MSKKGRNRDARRPSRDPRDPDRCQPPPHRRAGEGHRSRPLHGRPEAARHAPRPPVAQPAAARPHRAASTRAERRPSRASSASSPGRTSRRCKYGNWRLMPETQDEYRARASTRCGSSATRWPPWRPSTATRPRRRSSLIRVEYEELPGRLRRRRRHGRRRPVLHDDHAGQHQRAPAASSTATWTRAWRSRLRAARTRLHRARGEPRLPRALLGAGPQASRTAGSRCGPPRRRPTSSSACWPPRSGCARTTCASSSPPWAAASAARWSCGRGSSAPRSSRA